MTDIIESDTVSVTGSSDDGADRFDRVDKFERRRCELADATLVTLGELGYARTSLREIAQKTEFSHGVLHYYFKDKTDLITFGVRRYKEQCVTRYDDAIASAMTPADLGAAFAEAMVETLRIDTAMHRLWYDLRTQAAFEEALRPTVIDLDRQLQAMIWRVVVAYAALAEKSVVVDEFSAYAMFDGLFENCLIRSTSDNPSVEDTLRRQAVWVLDAVCE